VTLPPAGACDGQTLAAQALHAVGMQVVSVRRATGAVTSPDDALVLSGGDTLVLSGLPEPLALAEAKLLGKR
jgi:monovalent cation:H+ antiporter-2, CPA2 family